MIVNLFAGQPKFIELILNSILKKPKTMKSKLFTIDTRDLLHGLLVAFLTALITGTIDMLSKGTSFDWATMKPVLIAGISAGLSYILKNLATNSHNQLFRKEPV
jgi:branched-subunit amino acid transport protein